MTRTVRVATRASELARWQADHVAEALRAAHRDLAIEIVPVSTEGDRRTDVPLSEIGGKGVFSKEIQRAVGDGRADIAVHSAKDLQAQTPPGLVVAAIPPRADPRDALVGAGLADLVASVEAGAQTVVATGSARRRVQLAALVPGLRFAELRGNMATRLGQAAEFDAIVVAAAALQRLGLDSHISELLTTDEMVPQVGQGALAVECRSEDEQCWELLSAIDDPRSRLTVGVERAFLAELGGDCSLPAGAHCTFEQAAPARSGLALDGTVHIEGILGESVEPGTRVVRESCSGALGEFYGAPEVYGAPEPGPGSLGRELAASLRSALEAP